MVRCCPASIPKRRSTNRHNNSSRRIVITKPDLIQKWIFSPDGIVISDKGGAGVKGTWKFEESCVRINWSSLNLRTRAAHHWATLKRPLKPEGTKGDAWDGPDLIWAEKL